MVVQSPKLRHQALAEYFTSTKSQDENAVQRVFGLEARSYDFKELESHYDVGECQYKGSRFGRTNRIIVPVNDRETALQVFNTLEPVKELTKTKKKVIKAEKGQVPEVVDYPVTCTIARKSVFIERKNAGPIGAEPKDEKSTDEKPKDVDPKESKRQEAAIATKSIRRRLWNCYEDSGRRQDWIAKADRSVHPDAPWYYDVRYRPFFDQTLRLCIDFDLVPTVQKDRAVSDFVIYHFPANFPTAPASMSRSLKRLLQDIRVASFPASLIAPYTPLQPEAKVGPDSIPRPIVTGKADTTKTDTIETDTIETDTIGTDTTKTDPLKTDPLKTDPLKDESERILDVSHENIKANPVRSSSEHFRLQDNKVCLEDKESDLRQLIDSTADVLIGIIDGHGMSREKYDETAAELKRVGDRKHGAVTIKFIRGQMNFEQGELKTHIDTKYPGGLIIIGAHMSQPAPGATEYCPAVAALVASKPNDPYCYRATARVQPASVIFKQTYDGALPIDVSRTSRLVQIYQPKILKLKETMEHISRTWDESSKANGSNFKEPRVVFYRDSCHEMGTKAYDKEAEEISNAYKSVFKQAKDVPLSYITVGKNSRRHIPAPQESATKGDVCDARFFFTTSEYKEEDIKHIDGNNRREEDGAKYQYVVHANGNASQMAPADLQLVTGQLNVSSQICDYTSLALPVHYAQNLARRVLSYYD
ncbi:hypothetical protein BU23DRAFT_648718 [Bimuria novae-zelandiae CBS 107.79]|uniref:Piwi domain-containing protein n=1 Tax=Bimuria novae-zelandiae CBS 107.79 TaxID=1447943 RepID=A0A6A5V1D3_9PLEO|nr:hypothetical protein BU23DRAFT_648718 [Bimuria novae-zelandiae CBS 107.79]